MVKRMDWWRVLIVLLSVTIIGSCDKLPEGVDISDIPDYYQPYLDGRAAAINEAIANCSGDCETFFWITDIHWEKNKNEHKSPLLIKYLSNKTGIDKILDGGDNGNSQLICKNAITQLRNAIGSDKVYSVTGNHEMIDASMYESPFDRVADELRGHNRDIAYGDNDKSYFYLDNNIGKTRYIGLSCMGVYQNGAHESCYTAEQLSWFKEKALNVEAGWNIVIFTHTLYFVGTGDKIGVAGCAGAMDFIHAINDYQGNGTIACVLMGHAHRDRIHIGSSGVPYIISASDRHEAYYGDINVTRIPGTISEQHFEVVVIDKDKREIKLFAIGAKARNGLENEPGEEVDVRIVNY